MSLLEVGAVLTYLPAEQVEKVVQEVAVVVPPARHCPAAQSAQAVSRRSVGAPSTNFPDGQAVCAAQDVAVVLAPARHLPDAQLLQPVLRDADGVVETSASARRSQIGSRRG